MEVVGIPFLIPTSKLIMKARQIFSFLVVFILIITVSHAQKSNLRPGEIVTITKSYTDGVIDGYTFYLPKSYTSKAKKYPVILFLQGGSAVGGEIDVVNGWGIPKLIAAETDQSIKRNQYVLDSFIVVSPHMTAGSFKERQWYNQEAAIRELLKGIVSSYQADPTRIYVTGLSRGGHGTWGLAARMTDVFAAAVPICGGIHGVENFSPLAQLPIWVAHNTGDNTVDYNESTNAVQKIEALGGNTFLKLDTANPETSDYLKHNNIFTTFHRDGHDAWTDLYSSLALYQWLLRQRK